MTHKEFYNTKAWKRCRADYIKSVGGLCENCLKRGIYKPAVVAHHIKHLNDNNVMDAAIALNWDNLKAVCVDCHAEEHRRGLSDAQYRVDALGNLIEK